MDKFSPLVGKITESSIWREPYFVRILFVTMLAKKDSDQVVRADSYTLSIWANMPEEEVIEALRILGSPDTKRIDKGEHEGRRIKKVSDGWLVLSGLKYENYMRKIAEQARKAKWAREARALKKCNPLPGEVAYEAALRDGRQEDAERLLDNQPGRTGDS